MRSQLLVRPSDSPWLHSVSRWTIGDEPAVRACPDGFWDLVVYRKDGATTLLVTGQTTRAVELPFAPGDEILTLSFRPSVYLTRLPGKELVDRAVVLERTGNRFQLMVDSVEIPRFDNAEDLVRRLQRLGALQSDELVGSHLSGHPLAASPRSVQRHFTHATGMSPRDFFLIRRAQHAGELLRTGMPAAEVALVAGYSDQAHLCRSVKRFLGQTPQQLQPQR